MKYANLKEKYEYFHFINILAWENIWFGDCRMLVFLQTRLYIFPDTKT